MILSGYLTEKEARAMAKALKLKTYKILELDVTNPILPNGVFTKNTDHQLAKLLKNSGYKIGDKVDNWGIETERFDEEFNPVKEVR